MGANPRSLKRFVNMLAFISQHADTIKVSIQKDDGLHSRKYDLLKEYFTPVLYVKWALIVYCFPGTHNDIKGNWYRLIELQKAAREEVDFLSEEKGLYTDMSKGVEEGLLKILAIGKEFPEDEWLVKRFIHLAKASRISEDVKSGLEQDLMDDMVLVRKGNFLYGDESEEENIDYDFFIDVFPVTNRQYKEFLDANRYYRVPFVQKAEAELCNWDKKTNAYPEGKGDHPVVLVSIEDAKEYCQWRTEKDKKEGHTHFVYRLPTELEWEKAARGEDGRMFPWGEEFEKDRCNTSELGQKGTTPVTKYPNGKSPYRCREMAGNVFEWTTFELDNKEKAMLRGGCWANNKDYARCAYKQWNIPFSRTNYIGFRCIREEKNSFTEGKGDDRWN